MGPSTTFKSNRGPYAAGAGGATQEGAPPELPRMRDFSVAWSTTGASAGMTWGPEDVGRPASSGFMHLNVAGALHDLARLVLQRAPGRRAVRGEPGASSVSGAGKRAIAQGLEGLAEVGLAQGRAVGAHACAGRPKPCGRGHPRAAPAVQAPGLRAPGGRRGPGWATPRARRGRGAPGPTAGARACPQALPGASVPATLSAEHGPPRGRGCHRGRPARLAAMGNDPVSVPEVFTLVPRDDRPNRRPRAPRHPRRRCSRPRRHGPREGGGSGSGGGAAR